jgi:hypothetical protein
MPTVPTMSVIFHPRDNALVAGTYGRGLWVLDDAGPLETLTPDALAKEAVLASITRGREWNLPARQSRFGEGELFAANPELAPTISYYLRDAASGPVTITITDARGRAIRTLSGPAAQGLDRVTWDMRMDPADRMAAGRIAAVQQAGVPRDGAAGPNAGPLVAPGSYDVAIRIPRVPRELRGTIVVDGDAADTMSVADRAARESAVQWAYGLQKSLVAARAAMREASAPTAEDARVVSELTRLVGILGSLSRAIEGFDRAPTADQRRQLGWAYEDATKAIGVVNRLRPSAKIGQPSKPE